MTTGDNGCKHCIETFGMVCFELVSGKTDPVVLLIKVSKAVKNQPTPQLLLPQYYSVLLLVYKPMTYSVLYLFSTHQQSFIYTDATVCQGFYHHTTSSGGWSLCDQLITTSTMPSWGLLEKYHRAYNTNYLSLRFPHKQRLTGLVCMSFILGHAHLLKWFPWSLKILCLWLEKSNIYLPTPIPFV